MGTGRTLFLATALAVTVASALAGAATPAVASPATYVVRRPIPTSGVPRATAVDPLTGNLFSTDGEPNTLSMWNPTTRTTTAVPIQGGDLGLRAVAVDGALHRVFVADALSGVTAVDTRSLQPVGGISAGYRIVAMAVDQVTHTLLIADSAQHVLTVDERTLRVRQVATGHDLAGLAVDPRTGRVFATAPVDGLVVVIGEPTRAVVATVPVGASPTGVAVDPVSHRVWVTSYDDGSVTVIDGGTDQVIRTLEVGRTPYAVAVDPRDERVFVADEQGGVVDVLDGTTMTPSARVTVGRFVSTLSGDWQRKVLYSGNARAPEINRIAI